MHKSKCPLCGSSHTIKYGTLRGVQTYKCADCGYRFRNSRLPPDYEIWRHYQDNKQTVAELAESLGTSSSTIKRRLRNISIEWEQPEIRGSGYVHLDATYWGRSFGVLLALDAMTGKPLYMSFVRSETAKDYADAVQSIRDRDYIIRGIIIDGKQGLFKLFAGYPLQMCQFHMKQIVRRYLTLRPKLLAARALNDIMSRLTRLTEDEFNAEYAAWKEEWRDVINRRSVYKDGSTHYTHQRMRTAVRSLDFFRPFLFTCQRDDCQGMPNTNNKIEGTFTDLKKNLNNHSGLTLENRKRFICGFFLALTQKLSMKKQEPHQ